jgi:hypothetical protein
MDRLSCPVPIKEPFIMKTNSSMPDKPASARVRILATSALAALVAPALALAQETKAECDVATVKKEWATSGVGWWASLGSTRLESTRCSALLSVMRMAAASSKPAGRKLEAERPLDVKAAELERSQARADPAFARILAAELDAETIPLRRILREAALLHDEGFFKAGDLLVLQLRQEGMK